MQKKTHKTIFVIFVTKSKVNKEEHALKQHTDKIHEEVKFLCCRCQKEFDGVSQYDDHAIIHRNTKNRAKDLPDNARKQGIFLVM